jgi:hypothetical protein
VTAPQRRRPGDRRLFHHDKPRSLQVIDKALGDDRGHELARVVLPLAAVEPQRGLSVRLSITPSEVHDN